MSVPTVELAAVGRSFGRSRALSEVDLAIGPGITGLLGPNGAGKTTLLRVLSTVLAPSTGRCRLLGLDPADPVARTEIRRRLGYLPQESGHPRGFTAFRYVDYVAALKEWSERESRHSEVRRVLDLVGMGDLAGKRMSALSGGQRRRTALAQALLGEPDLLVLDEPTGGLDPEQRASLRGVLSAAGARSTVLLSTHQTEDVSTLCERVIVLDAGRVRYDGSVTDLVAIARGRVWLSDGETAGALASWRTGDGTFRHVAPVVPAGVSLADPTLEDAYLLLRGSTVADARESRTS